MSRERTRPVHTPPGGPPQGPRPPAEVYAAMGEAGVFALIAELYEVLERSEVRHLFPDDMPAASRRSAAFFVQLLGGPPRYSEAYGPPRMRRRHLPFEIDARAREVWLAAFDEVLATAPERHGFPAEHVEAFRAFLESFSAWMVNVAPE